MRRPPVASEPGLPQYDTILLEAQRLRGNTADIGKSATFSLHADRQTRLQIIVPQGSPKMVYSIDIHSAALQATSGSIHLDGLRLSQTKPLPYIEVLLSASALAPAWLKTV